MKALVEKYARARRAGVGAILRCRLDRLGLYALRLIFRFDPWHANAPSSCRPYKRIVVGLANSLRPSIVVEIGCGLGDIVGRVEAAERIGIDVDSRVIRAARFLHHGRGRWVHGDASCVPRLIAEQSEIDCLIMVNWIHSLSPRQLSELLLPLLPRTRHLILDAIDADGPPTYRYKHNFDFLPAGTRRLTVARALGEPRSFILFEIAA